MKRAIYDKRSFQFYIVGNAPDRNRHHRRGGCDCGGSHRRVNRKKSDCAGCSHAGKCNGHCCSQDKDVDWTELVKKRKAELEAEREKAAQQNNDSQPTDND